MKKSLLVTFSILIIAVLGAAIFVSFPKTEQTAKKKIVASIFSTYDIARNVVGDKLSVELILPPGASPHTYEPSPQDAVKMQNAEIVFVVGYGLDIWAENLAAANAPQAKIVTLDRSINLKMFEGSVDPHYFVSVSNAAIIARTIMEEAIKIDPHNTAYYQTSARNYNSQLEDLFNQGQAKLSTLTDKRLITFHEAFAYFAQDFGLEIAATIEPFPGKEPTAQYLAQVSAIIDKYHIKALFKEPQLSSVVLEGLARDKGIAILTLDPEGGTANSFIQMMRNNIETVWEGMK